MERGPLIQVLEDMVGSAKELDLHMTGASETVELRNVEKVEALISQHAYREFHSSVNHHVRLSD